MVRNNFRMADQFLILVVYHVNSRGFCGAYRQNELSEPVLSPIGNRAHAVLWNNMRQGNQK